jgi:hypothetical protein
LGYAVGAFAALVLGAWIAVPPIVHGQVESRLSTLLDRTTTVGSVAFDPLRLRLTLGKLAIARRTGTDSLFTVDELSADVSLASLWHRAPVLDALSIVRPYLWLARDGEGQYNVQDLIDALLARPIEVPRASINNIEIVDGTVVFVDLAMGRTHEVKALDAAIPFLSSLPYEASIRVTPRVQGIFNGSRFALAGSSTPFAERRELALDVDVDALPLASYAGYLPVRPRFVVAGGALTTKLQVVFVGAAGREPRLELRGEARVDGLAVHRPDGTALLSAQRLAVALDRIDLPRRDARIAAVTIDAPALDVIRLADGTFEWQHVLRGSGPPAPATPVASPGPAWGVRVDRLVVDRGTISLADAASTFRSTLVDVAVDAAGLASRPGEKGRVKLGFQSSDRIASFTAEADVEPGVPAASGRFALSGFSLGLLFPFYQSALAVDVQKGSLEYASAFTLGGDGNLRLDGGEATIADLRLALPGSAQPMWRVPQLSLRGIDVDVGGRSVIVADLQGRGATLSVRREPDGTLEMARIVKVTDGTQPADEAGWTVLAKTLAIRGVALDLEDRVPQPAATLALRDLALTATDVGGTAAGGSRVELSARVGKRGRIAFAGPFSRKPFGGEGRLELSGFPLVALKPYVEPRVNVVLTDGTLTASGRLALGAAADGALQAAWQGDVAVADFAALDRPTASDLARWKLLTLTGCDVATSPLRASVARIGLDDFVARVIVYPDASLNVMRLLTPGASPEPAAEAAPPPASAPTPPRDALPVAIGRIDLNRGNVNFSDLYVKPNYSANLTEVAGSVTALSAERAGKVTISARIDHSAPVEVEGTVHPFAKELSLDLAAKATNIDLPPLTPYAGKYAGYGIEKGQLSFDVRYQVENRKLSAENRLVLDQLQFGARVESPDATKLPVLLAVALLKDSRGVIDVRLPISGSLDDPQFSLGRIIVQIVVNLITKAVTAPFALLSAVFGGGEELSTLPFAPGSAVPGTDARQRIETLGKALLDRPALELDIAGRADPIADGEALRHAAVLAAMRHEKMKALVAAGEAPSSVDQVTIGEDERARWLTAAYRAATIPDRPRNLIGLPKELPPAEMEAMLLATVKVGDEDLRALANARALAVSDALAARGIADSRLFLVAPRIGADPAASPAAAGAAARVDLALR